MKLYNSLTREKQEFLPLGDTVTIYGCGPTVYNYFHIGNARMFVVFDTLRRYMNYRGMNVKYVQNFTDVDDKMINKANSEGVSVAEIAERFIGEYFTDADGLRIRRADVHPRATETIPEMLALIGTLIEKGLAYEADGDVYYRAKAFKGYGKLSHQPLEELEAGARIDIAEKKEDPMDFALWKAAKPGEPHWASPWGEGRPGWHIECSAMAGKYLGKTIDIHCGGQDLAFPHHENEIAQSEGANSCQFARFWLHNGYINVDNKKMSKSLNNFFTVRDVANRYGYSPIRFFLLSAQYRTPINYTTEILEQSISAEERIKSCRSSLEFAIQNGAPDGETGDIASITARKEQFIAAMDDDINTADAIAAIFDLVRDVNPVVNSGKPVKTEYAKAALAMLCELCDVLQIAQPAETVSDGLSDDEVFDMLRQRAAARKAKDFKAADAIRDKLSELGITVEDTPQGPKITRADKRSSASAN